MALRDLAQKGLISPGTPSLARTPNPSPGPPGHLSPSFETGNTAFPPEDRGPQERGSLGGELRNRSTTDTVLDNRHAHKDGHAHTLHRHTGPPRAKGLGSGSSSSRPWPRSNLVTGGVEKLPASPPPTPLPADSKRAQGQGDLILTVGPSDQSPAPPSSWASLLSLAPAGEFPAPALTSPHKCPFSGQAFSQYQ